MIHAGSASGGHYYAYIKDFTKQEWFCFNDQSVSPVRDGECSVWEVEVGIRKWRFIE